MKIIDPDILQQFAERGATDEAAKRNPAGPGGKNGRSTAGRGSKAGIGESPERLQQYLEERGLRVKNVKSDGTRTLLILDGCPMNPEHGNRGDTSIVLRASGMIGFACQHNGCSKTTWPEVRAKIDPEYGRQRERAAKAADGSARPADEIATEWLLSLKPRHHRKRKAIYFDAIGDELPLSAIWMQAPTAIINSMSETAEGVEFSTPPKITARVQIWKTAVLLAASRMMLDLPEASSIEADVTVDADELQGELISWLLRERSFRTDTGVLVSTSIYAWSCSVDPAANWTQCYVLPVWARVDGNGLPSIAVKGEHLRGELRRDSLKVLARDLRAACNGVTDQTIRSGGRVWRVWGIAPAVLQAIATADCRDTVTGEDPKTPFTHACDRE